MAEIPTLLGSVSSDRLGIVSMNEHLLFGYPGWQYASEVTFDRATAFEKIRSSLDLFKQCGGGTILDASGITLGRDVTFYRRLSEVTEVQIMAATGFQDQPSSILGHFSAYSSLYRTPSEPHQHHWHREIPGHFYPSHGGTNEYFMFVFFNELTEGMVAPGMIRTKMKAGIVTAASSWDQITPTEEFSLRGAALAAKKAGTGLIIGGINQARKQLQIVLEEGIQAERIIFGQCDDGRAIDLERDKEFAQKGAYVSYDHIGWEDPSMPYAIPDEQRVDLVKEMVDAGFAEHIILSCSSIGYPLGVPQPTHSMAHLLKSFVPKLRKAGIAESTIDTILAENPKRILTRQRKEGG